MLRNSAGKKAVRRRWRRMIQLGLLVLLVADLLLAALAFLPAQSFAGQRKDLEKLRDDLKAKRETVARLQKVEANLSEARRQGDEFYAGKFLPKAIGYSRIMEEVDKAAVATGVRKGAVAYSLGEVKNRPDLQAVEISTSLEGDYTKVVRFINQLEQSPLFLTVDSMNLASTQGRTIKLVVKLVTYFRVA